MLEASIFALIKEFFKKLLIVKFKGIMTFFMALYQEIILIILIIGVIGIIEFPFDFRFY